MIDATTGVKDLAKEFEAFANWVDEKIGNDDFKANVINFAHEMIDPDEPSTFQMAASYLSWARTRVRLAVTDVLDNNCDCIGGWVQSLGVGVYPCERCSASAHQGWVREYVNDGEPH